MRRGVNWTLVGRTLVGGRDGLRTTADRAAEARVDAPRAVWYLRNPMVIAIRGTAAI